ncbi:putative NSF attachment protein [Helianthus annuus]|nr:putative NSF attachment protein [Helianthus annuus]KAJ0746577.1 putative NSF attachment protein [Helianthus annuus]
MELQVCLLVNYPKHYSNSPEDTLALLYAAQEIAELYEQEQNLEQAIAYYDKAADLFQGEEVTTSANQCKQKIAQFSAQLEQYQKAIEIYDEIARQSVNNNLLKYGVRGHLLNAGICQLCKGDVAITNALERYQELDPAFSGTREYKLLADMAAAMDKEDVAKFTDAVKEFDSITKLVIITLLWSYITQDRY